MSSSFDTGQRSWSTNLYGSALYGTGKYGVGLGLTSFYLKGIVQDNCVNTTRPTVVWVTNSQSSLSFDLKLVYDATGYEILVSRVTTDAGEYQLLPNEALPVSMEGSWTAYGRVYDPTSGWTNWEEAFFTLDLVPPVAPTLDSVTSPSIDFSQTLTGTKQPGDYVVVNGYYATGTENSSWSYELFLNSGLNDISVISRDSCGNDSGAVTAQIELATVTPEIVNKWNAFDEFGFLLNVKRHLGETNLNYKSRLLRYFK